jgi:hypothetical protein
MTNAEKIRQMSDEELALFVSSSDRCPYGHFLGDYDCKCQRCEDCWLDWLKQEMEE